MLVGRFCHSGQCWLSGRLDREGEAGRWEVWCGSAEDGEGMDVVLKLVDGRRSMAREGRTSISENFLACLLARKRKSGPSRYALRQFFRMPGIKSGEGIKGRYLGNSHRPRHRPHTVADGGQEAYLQAVDRLVEVLELVFLGGFSVELLGD